MLHCLSSDTYQNISLVVLRNHRFAVSPIFKTLSFLKNYKPAVSSISILFIISDLGTLVVHPLLLMHMGELAGKDAFLCMLPDWLIQC